MTSVLFNKSRLFLLTATLIGGALEWYELYLFVHWGSIFTKLFFHDHEVLATYNVFFIFFVGVLGRPVGAILFGGIGDRLGRKVAFTQSIALLVLPSILIGTIDLIVPATGAAMAIILCLLRFIQGMAVGAELPGAMCYLAESAPLKKRALMCSFVFIGPHLGILLSQVESLILDVYFSQHFVETYGWRLSFIFGAIAAMIAVFFRSRLHESEKFTIIKEKKQLTERPFINVISHHWKRLFDCFFALFGPVVVFFLYSIFLEEYLDLFIETKRRGGLWVGIIISLSQIILLPFLGMLGDAYPVRKLFITSLSGISCLALSLFFFNQLPIIVLIAVMILILLDMQSALVPYYITQLFPTAVRYTAIALSFTLCDSLVGGAAPWLGGLVASKIGLKSTFIIFTAVSSLISLCFFIRSKNIGRLYLNAEDSD